MSLEVADSDTKRSAPVRVRARVVSHEREGAANRRIVFGVEDWPGWTPGQFVMLSPGPESAAVRYDPLLARPMAIFDSHGEPGHQQIEVLYKVVGRGTRLLATASVGDRVRVVGPLGRGFATPEAGSWSILVAGGTGAASLYGLARHALARGPVTVVLGAQRAELLMAARDFEKLGVDLKIATEDGSRGTQGLVTDVLADLLGRADETDGIGDNKDNKDQKQSTPTLFACGPTGMMRACGDLARGAGVRCRVALENRMACGFGVCLGCAVPMARGGFSLVCKRGPVYDAALLDWSGIP